MRKLLVTFAIVSSVVAGSAQADGLPKYLEDTLPGFAANDIVKGWGTMQGEGATLDAKTRELIALAVAAQIPCDYCSYAHETKARKLGASDEEIHEAIATAGYIRLFSTVLNGHRYDRSAFEAEYDERLGGS